MPQDSALVKTNDEFRELVGEIQKTKKIPFAFGIGQNFTDSNGNSIAVRWLTVNVKENMCAAAVIIDHLDLTDTEMNGICVRSLSGDDCLDILFKYFQPFENDGKYHANIEALKFGLYKSEDDLTVIFYFDEVELYHPIQSDDDARFRLALMSRRYFQPNQMNLEKIFDHLPNLVWTTKRPYTIEDWNQKWFENMSNGEQILAVDKFPPMFWANPVPSGVRVANVDMVRDGAHLGDSTTVMHYAFVNFNAGSLGKAMIEGRVPAGITIDEGTDVGAGAGFLGTLSGGNTIKIKTGKKCLIGAMAECGIPLGDDVCIAAGVVFTGNTPVEVVKWKVHEEDGKFETGDDGKPIEIDRIEMKAIALSGVSNVTFRRNAITGTIEVLPIPNKAVLNDMLHQNKQLVKACGTRKKQGKTTLNKLI